MPERRNNIPLWVLALLDKNLSAIEYRVLTYLLWRQGDNRSAWPGIERIADDLALSESTVRRVIKELSAKGWLTKTPANKGGRGRTNHYSVKGVTGDRVSAQKGITDDRVSGVNPVTSDGKTLSPVNAKHLHRTLSTKKSAQTLKPRQRKAAQAVVYTPEFERVWDSYPRKVNKRQAFEVWTALAPDPELTEKIVTSIQEYTESEQWSRSLADDGGQYVPHLATFLNQRRWEDILPVRSATSPGELNLDGSTEEEIRTALQGE